MQAATINLFATYSDELKSLCLPVVHNIFQDSNAVSKLMEEKNCLINRTNNSFFLLIPRHDFYYDMLYMSADRGSLYNDLNTFLKEQNPDYRFRTSIIGHELPAGEIADIFTQCGFTLGRKIARMRNLNYEKDIEGLSALRCDDEQYAVEFAVKGDEQGIFDLLMAEFDIRSDNVPELTEISENIRNKQVVLIRNEEKIMALHYFTRQHSCVYGWYDVIIKEYRKRHLYLYIMRFLYNYWKKEEKAMRSYSWRDVANKRLMQLARQCNQVPDGVYIYNMLYDPEKVLESGKKGA